MEVMLLIILFLKMNVSGLKMKKSILQRFQDKYIPEPNSGCWLWTANCIRGGYGGMFGDKKTARAHKISYELYKGIIPNGLHVCHRCDTRSCVNPDHLFLGTAAENTADMMRKNRGKRPILKGYESGRSKLTPNQLNEIRLALNNGISGRSLSIKYNVSDTAISRIKSGKTYKIGVP